MSQLKNDLAKAHLEILSQAKTEAIFSQKAISGVFLPSVTQAYEDSGIKVMVIGQETRSWRESSCEVRNKQVATFDGVLASMQATEEFNQKQPRKSRFRQLYRKVSKTLAVDSSEPNTSAIWANQFCVSLKKGSPTKAQAFDDIADLSSKLLQAQFDVLQPDIAIFAVGSGRDKYIKQAFPEYQTQSVIHPRRLWHFKIGNTHCFRINHPRWHGTAPYLQQAIDEALALVRN